MDDTPPRPKLGLGDWIIAVIFAAIILVVAAQVVWRYALNDSLSWTEELSKYLFTWLIFIGAALAVRDGTHIRVDLLTRKLPRRAAGVLHRIHLAGIVAFFGFLAYHGWLYVVDLRSRNSPSPALRIPMNVFVYTAAPVAAALGLWFGLRRLLSRRDPDDPPHGGEEVM